MVYGAIDLHMRYSQIRIIDEAGMVLRDQRVPTTRERLRAAFASDGAMRILVETGTESEWVAQALEAAGPRGDRGRSELRADVRRDDARIKTDRRDAAALAEANRRGWYRVDASDVGGAAGDETDVAQPAVARADAVGRGESAAVAAAAIGLSPRHRQLRDGATRRRPAGGPERARRDAGAAVRQIAALTTEIHALDARLQTRTASDAIVARLRSVPGVGLIVATTFRAFVDRHERFAHAGQVSAAIGLVPREDSSAERRHRGHITKAGPRELRSLLIQAAWVCWRTRRQWHVARVGGPPRGAARPTHRGRRAWPDD